MQLNAKLAIETWDDVLNENNPDIAITQFMNTFCYHFNETCPKKILGLKSRNAINSIGMMRRFCSVFIYLVVQLQYNWYSYHISLKSMVDMTNDKLNQEEYIKSILKRFDMLGCNKVSTPMETKLSHPNEGAESNIVTNVPYQELIGCLLYLH